jgi:hypothetical protein
MNGAASWGHGRGARAAESSELRAAHHEAQRAVRARELRRPPLPHHAHPEIDQLDRARLPVEEHVLELDVTVADLAVVAVLYRAQQLPEHGARGLLVEPVRRLRLH